MISEISIRRETEADHFAVENLTREAFWNIYRPGCTEHYVLHRFRSSPDFIPELDLVMESDGHIIGHIMYVNSKILTPDGAIPIVTFGPVSIAPDLKRRGYGKKLVDYSLQKAAEFAGAVAITGNIAFYGKSGFVTGSSKGIRYAYAEPDDDIVPYFLVKELKPGFLDGVSGTFSDPEGYLVAESDPEDFERFDSLFPPKEKIKLPGQLA